ncbi:hypothetical protein [Enterocloster bolteae]|uniref:hypothetical protein n=1 Tax=Enterocloster bolteae TaxID=208479 RepID=UPI002A814B46|nr:hypothetical protein [Enterocloster bolteae]
MKVIEFIAILEQLGFNDNTELSFGFLNGAQGEYYECNFKSIDDNDREVGCDDLIVEFEKPDDYIKSEIECANTDLRENLLNVINGRL